VGEKQYPSEAKAQLNAEAAKELFYKFVKY
jgi:hypothetical protein